MAVQITNAADARRIVADFHGEAGNNMRRGSTAWGAAVFGPLLAIPGVLVAIPPTAHSLMHSDASPVALLGTLFFGWIGWAGIRSVRRYRAAKRYLAQHGG